MSNTKPQDQEAQRTLSRIFEKEKKREQIQTKKKNPQPRLSISNSKIKKNLETSQREEPIEKQE